MSGKLQKSLFLKKQEQENNRPRNQKSPVISTKQTRGNPVTIGSEEDDIPASSKVAENVTQSKTPQPPLEASRRVLLRESIARRSSALSARDTKDQEANGRMHLGVQRTRAPLAAAGIAVAERRLGVAGAARRRWPHGRRHSAVVASCSPGPPPSSAAAPGT